MGDMAVVLLIVTHRVVGGRLAERHGLAIQNRSPRRAHVARPIRRSRIPIAAACGPGQSLAGRQLLAPLPLIVRSIWLGLLPSFAKP